MPFVNTSAAPYVWYLYVTIAEIKWEMLSNQRSYRLQHMCKWLCSVLQIWTSNSSNETNVTWHSISWYVSCLLNKTTFNTKQICDFVQFWSTYTKWKPQWQFIRQFSVVERPNQAFSFSFSAKEGTGVDLQEKDGLTENEKACQRLNEIWQEAQFTSPLPPTSFVSSTILISFAVEIT